MKMLGTVLWPVSSTIKQKKRGLRLKHVIVGVWIWLDISSLHTCQSSLDRGAVWVDVELDYFEGNIFILEKRLSPLAEWTIAGNDTEYFCKTLRRAINQSKENFHTRLKVPLREDHHFIFFDQFGDEFLGGQVLIVELVVVLAVPEMWLLVCDNCCREGKDNKASHKSAEKECNELRHGVV